MGQAGVGGGEPGAWLDEQRQHSREFGGWLREQREDRFWSRAEMARQLFAAAHANGDAAVPGVASISSNIYRWERGAVAPGERYRLYYCKAFGISSASFGVPGPPQASAVLDGHAEAVLGFLAEVMDNWGQLTRQLGAEPPGGTGPGLSAAGPDRALDALRLSWGDAYSIGYGSGQWQAMRRDGTRLLTGAAPGELNAVIRADWARERTS